MREAVPVAYSSLCRSKDSNVFDILPEYPWDHLEVCEDMLLYEGDPDKRGNRLAGMPRQGLGRSGGGHKKD